MCSLPTHGSGALERPPNSLGRRRIQTRRYTDIGREPDAQVLMETVPVSNDSSDVYEGSREWDQTELDSELDTEDDDIASATEAGLRQRSRIGDKQTNNLVTTVWVSTTSISREVVYLRWTPTA